MKRYTILYLLFTLLLTPAVLAQGPQVSIGHVKRFANFSSEFVAPRNVDVWLPGSYDPSKSYAVLYMQDGQMLFDSTLTWNNQEWKVDEVVGSLVLENKIEDCIVVGIWNSGSSRNSDYLPQKPFEATPQQFQDNMANMPRFIRDITMFSADIQSDKYLKFLVTELKPFIDRTFSTKPGKEHTFIAGSSMGGLLSLYAICEYPEVFGGAASLSTHWVGTLSFESSPFAAAFIAYLKENLPAPATHKIYFDYGTASLDALYEQYQQQADELMQANGYDSLNWMTRKFEGAGHSERAWSKRLAIPVTFLLGKKEEH